MKSVIAIICLVAVVSGSDEDYFRKLDALRPEMPCNQKGGFCTFAADCPQLTEESGLCPEQRSQGVECCYGLSVRETRCEKQGGQCMALSSCRPEFERATDCAAGEKCCILV